VLFIAQMKPVAARRVDLHRKLGVASALFAVLLVIVGVLTVIATTITHRVSLRNYGDWLLPLTGCCCWPRGR
jgi:hypothetical protein